MLLISGAIFGAVYVMGGRSDVAHEEARARRARRIAAAANRAA